MAFRFKRRESVAAGFARLAAGEIDDAVAALEKSSSDGTHEARKCIKRLRGLLRLFRRALPEGSHDREDEALRAAGDKLSALRDAQVIVSVFDLLVKGVKAPGIRAARRQFAAAAKAAAVLGENAKSPLRAAITALRSSGARLPGLKPDSGWSALGRGLKSTYRRARQAHAAAHAELTTAAMQAWRRCSEDFESQLLLLAKIDPPAMKRRIARARRLTALLGNDRDLAVFARALAAAPDVAATLREKLEARLARRRRKRQREAFKLGSELFLEKPSVVVKELGRNWKRWRRG